MAITIELPPAIEAQLRRLVPSLDAAAREQFLLTAYTAGQISLGDLAEILSVETRVEAQQWLAERGVSLNYTSDALEADRLELSKLLNSR